MHAEGLRPPGALAQAARLVGLMTVGFVSAGSRPPGLCILDNMCSVRRWLAEGYEGVFETAAHYWAVLCCWQWVTRDGIGEQQVQSCLVALPTSAVF